MDSIKISIEEAQEISNLLLEVPAKLGGYKEQDIARLRASLYKKIMQAQKKAGRRRSESTELLALIKANQEKIK